MEAQHKTQQSDLDNRPWYKEFWPWFLIILPATVVCASIWTLKIAIDHQDDLVSADYYKKGKAINMDLSKVQKARQLGLQFGVTFSENQVIIRQHGGDSYQTALKLELYHPTLAERDQQAMLTLDGQGNYRYQSNNSLQGAWDLKLSSFDDSWRLQQRVNAANSEIQWLN